jgi:hypothetical protein
MWKPTIVLTLIAIAALSGCRGGKPNGSESTTSTAAPPTGVSARATPPSCNGQEAVWVLGDAKVFLVPGDRLYGKTKRGRYLCLSDAQAEGYKAARRPFRHHRHHDNLFSV